MEKHIAFGEHTTWCRITGELGAGPPPVVILHGGPGAAHNYTLSMRALAGDGRAVIHYDQLGCGNSTHLPDAEPGFWNVELFVAELDNLVDALGIGAGFHVVGQSWGGMLGAEVAVRRPQGLLSLSICNSPASMPRWIRAAAELRAALPVETQRVLTLHEQQGTIDSPDYLAAAQVYYDRHLCRIVPNPPDLVDTFAQVDADPTVYRTMNGPNDFHVIGTLKDWDIIDRLHLIDVPKLVVGEHDEATPYTWRPFVDGIADVRRHLFAGASHCPHLESPEEFTHVVGGFLRSHDGG